MKVLALILFLALQDRSAADWIEQLRSNDAGKRDEAVRALIQISRGIQSGAPKMTTASVATLRKIPQGIAPNACHARSPALRRRRGEASTRGKASIV